MITPEEKADLSQISLTGLRGLTMLGLLIQAPRSLEEIREKYLSLGLIDESSSNDIIRIDMNTLRSMGCDISRSSAKTENKHVLTKHPYGLTITKEDVRLLKRAYRIIKDGMNLANLLEYDNLFKKMSEYVFDEEIKNELCGISTLKYYDNDYLEELLKDCQVHNVLTIEYKDGGTSELSQKNICAEEIKLRSDKIYLFGTDVDTNLAVMLPIKRINKVLAQRGKAETDVKSEPVEVKFYLKYFNAAGMDDCEEIVESNDDGSQTLIGRYHNEFIAIQRMLSFGPACIVLEPANIRQKVIDKLLAMREVYKK